MQSIAIARCGHDPSPAHRPLGWTSLGVLCQQCTFFVFLAWPKHCGIFLGCDYNCDNIWWFGQRPGKTKKNITLACAVIQLTTRTGRHPHYRMHRYAASALRFMFLRSNIAAAYHEPNCPMLFLSTASIRDGLPCLQRIPSLAGRKAGRAGKAATFASSDCP